MASRSVKLLSISVDWLFEGSSRELTHLNKGIDDQFLAFRCANLWLCILCICNSVFSTSLHHGWDELLVCNVSNGIVRRKCRGSRRQMMCFERSHT
jgi:hypothetical protein